MDQLNFGQMYESFGSDEEPLPAGKYDVTVTSVKVVETKTGKPMLKLSGKVANGPHANKGVYDNMVITVDSDTAMYIFFKDLAAHGLGKDFFATNPSLDAIASALEGTTANWNISIQSSGAYAGNNEVKGKSAVAGGASTTAAPAPAPAPAKDPVYDAAPVPAPAPNPPHASGQPGF